MLLERGLAGLSIAGVASRAGCDRRSITRRWPTARDLAAASVADLCPAPVPVPETTSLEEDLLWLYAAAERMLANPLMGRLIRRLAAEFDADPMMRATYQAVVLEPWREAIRPALARAQARDELRDDLDPRTFVQALLGPLIAQTMLHGERPAAGDALAVVSLLLDGVRRRP
jgi:AcrR family transcriptional regulator